jgi:hypothetical protein
MTITTAPMRRFRLDLHDVRSGLPAAIQAIMQNGLLERTFEDALLPPFLFPAIADIEPWSGGLGDTQIMTRAGLLTPTTTAITGSDPSPSTYTVEQWQVTMDQYGGTMDTNLLQSSMVLASKYLLDVQKLGIQAGQSLNRIARNKLMAAYGGGRTWGTATASSDSSLIVNDSTGFTKVLVNGVPTAVSASNPLTVTIAGVANTVTGVSGNTLTLGTARADTAGDYIVAANAPVSFRAGTSRNSDYDMASTDIATFALFRSAVARLRKQNVPTMAGGYYTAHISADTEAQLFADSDFKQALQGRVDSPIYRDLSIGRFGGIDWVRNNELTTISNGGSGGNVNVAKCMVLGEGALVQAPFSETGTLLSDTSVDSLSSVRMIGPANGVNVALIVRPAQDRLQQNVATTWSWIGDYGVPSDSGTGDAALFKRAVMVEHAFV